MTYFKINNIDFSMYVNKLKVSREHTYKSQTNASGNTVVKYINTKRVIEVGIIPLDQITMFGLQQEIDKFKVNLSFYDPSSASMVTAVPCIIPKNDVEYYTIQADGAKFKAFTLKFQEL